MGKEFWSKAGVKLIETILSVKVWTIAAFLSVSTVALYNGKIDGTTWSAVNGGIISAVFAMREAFKVAKVKSDKDSDKLMV